METTNTPEILEEIQTFSKARQKLVSDNVRVPLTILSVDGGGIRGIVPLLVLKYMELMLGSIQQDSPFKPRYVHSLFDFAAGTSTGSIVVGGLGAGVSIDAMLRLYLNRRRTIFSRFKFGKEVAGLLLGCAVNMCFRFFNGHITVPTSWRDIFYQLWRGTLIGSIAGITSFFKLPLKLAVGKMIRTVLVWSCLSYGVTQQDFPIVYSMVAGALFGAFNGYLYEHNRFGKAAVDAISYGLYGLFSTTLLWLGSKFGCSQLLSLSLSAVGIGLLDHSEAIQNNITGHLVTRYSRIELDDLLEESFGNTVFNNTAFPLIIPSISMVQGRPNLMSFTRWSTPGDRLDNAIGASTAAPTFFPPKEHNNVSYIDGGLLVNNPSLYGLLLVRRQLRIIYPDFGNTIPLRILSLGTGENPIQIDWIRNTLHGNLGWVRRIIEIQGSSVLNEYVLNELIPDVTCRRLQVQLNTSVQLDGVDEDNINNIIENTITDLKQTFHHNLCTEIATICRLNVANILQDTQNLFQLPNEQLRAQLIPWYITQQPPCSPIQRGLSYLIQKAKASAPVIFVGVSAFVLYSWFN